MTKAEYAQLVTQIIVAGVNQDYTNEVIQVKINLLNRNVGRKVTDL